jgi:hypothetical protein
MYVPIYGLGNIALQALNWLWLDLESFFRKSVTQLLAQVHQDDKCSSKTIRWRIRKYMFVFEKCQRDERQWCRFEVRVMGSAVDKQSIFHDL